QAADEDGSDHNQDGHTRTDRHARQTSTARPRRDGTRNPASSDQFPTPSGAIGSQSGCKKLLVILPVADRFERQDMTIVAAALFGLLALFFIVRFSCAWLMRRPRIK